MDKCNWPFGPITCRYDRTEFTRRRGLMHVHGALRIDGAPKYLAQECMVNVKWDAKSRKKAGPPGQQTINRAHQEPHPQSRETVDQVEEQVILAGGHDSGEYGFSKIRFLASNSTALLHSATSTPPPPTQSATSHRPSPVPRKVVLDRASSQVESGRAFTSLFTKPIKAPWMAAPRRPNPHHLHENPQAFFFTPVSGRRVPRKKPRMEQPDETSSDLETFQVQRRREQVSASKRRSRADPTRKSAEQALNTSCRRQARERERMFILEQPDDKANETIFDRFT
ncbi:unnamed protein product [Allacma fusca]|uniref:Uncharacterized protein n=1 Tax=Allacma fusca TaxID=39272 RepID=A0A8J2L9L4_9HEXA|nr:unnamed protein product [Allacma fusca]